MKAHLIRSATQIKPIPIEFHIKCIVGALLQFADVYYREKHFGEYLLITFSPEEKKKIVESSFCIVGFFKITGPGDEERVFVSALQAVVMRFNKEKKGYPIHIRVASFKIVGVGDDDNGFILSSPPQATEIGEKGIVFSSFDGVDICC